MVLAAVQASAQNYSVTPVTEPPTWAVDLSYNQGRPDWQEPSSGRFENWTVILVELEDALKPYASADDMMAIFVGTELRGLASPATIVGNPNSGATSFLLKVWGNESSDQIVDITLQYYCSKLKNIFSLTDNYSTGKEQGVDEAFVPPLSLWSFKYPASTSIDVNGILASEGIVPSEGDIIGAFVGDDCRGVSALPLTDGKLTVSGHNPGERLTLKYYDAANGQVLTFDVPVTVAWPGDVNGDGFVNSVDAVCIAKHLLKQEPEVFIKTAADVNDDGAVDAKDIVAISRLMLVYY